MSDDSFEITKDEAEKLNKELPQRKQIEKQEDDFQKRPIDKTIVNLPYLLKMENYFVKEKFKAPIMAKDIAITHFFKSYGFLVTKDDKKIWRYNGGYWQDDGEDTIRDIMQQVLGETSNTRYKQEVLNWIKDNAKLHIKREIFDENPFLIGFKNGTFDINTGEFKEHRPDKMLTSVLPIDYKPEEKCEKFLAFLDDVLYKEDIEIIQEMFGYCLYKKYSLAALFFLVGTGRNGKSTLLDILIAMLGKQNISEVPLQHLCNDRFASVDLYHKFANICADLSPDELKRTGMIKMLTGNDYIRAQNKHERAFKFMNFAKLIFAMNTIPDCNDNTDAWTQRMIVIEFPNKFLIGGEKTDPYIFDKINAELPGIFNWSLIGLKRLLENKKFSSHRTLEDVKEFLATAKNPVFQFVHRFIDGDPNGEETKDVVYSKFLDFAKKEGFPTMAANHFSMKFKELAPHGLEEGQSRILGNKRTWKGITFRKGMDDNSTSKQSKIGITTDFFTDKQQEEENNENANDAND